MKKTNVFKLFLILLIGLVSSCQDDEIIALEEESIEANLLADNSQYKTYHDVYGKDGKLIGKLDDELDFVDEAGNKVIDKRFDTNLPLGAVFYQHAGFSGTKQVIYVNGDNTLLRNSDFVSDLRTGITGVYVGPGCSVELYSQDNYVNLIRTIPNGSDIGNPVHYLGSQDEDTRSVIIRCVRRQTRGRFLGFVHEDTRYRGRSIPFFRTDSPYKPNSIAGFTTSDLSSVSLNRFVLSDANPAGGILLTTPDDDETAIIAHREDDVSNLGRLNDDRELFLGYFPDLSMYVPNYDLDEAPRSNYEIENFLEELDRNNIPMAQRRQVTRVQLANLCGEVRSNCATANAKFESDGITLSFVCAAALDRVKRLMEAAATPTAVQVAAIGSFQFLRAGSGATAATAIQAFVAANPVTTTLVAAGVVGCIYAAHHAVKVPSLEECKEARVKCMDTYYYNILNCTDC